MVSDEFFRAIIRNCSDIIAVIDVNGIIEYISPSAERILGYDPASMIGKEFVSFIHPKCLESVEKSFEDAMKHQKTVQLQKFLVLHKDGKWRTFEGRGEGIVDVSGRLQVVANARDITDQLEAYRALAESEQRYRLLAETSKDIIIIIDENSSVRYANQCAADIFNKNPEALIGMHVESLFPFYLASEQKKGIDAVFRDGEAINGESEIAFPKGKVWLDTWLIPIKDQNGRVIQVFGVSRDISAKKEAEKQLEQRSQLAEEATIEAQEYFDYLAHDIANLVAPIMNYAETMAQKEDVSPEAKKYSLRIIEQVKEIATFLLNLRTLSEVQKITAADIDSIDLAQCLSDITRSIDEHYPNRKFRLHYEKPPFDEVKAVGGKYMRNMLTLELDRAARYAYNQDIDVYMKIISVVDEFGSEFWQMRLEIPNLSLPNKFKELLSVPFDPSRKRMEKRRATRNLSFLAAIVEHFGGKLWFEDLSPSEPQKGFSLRINLPKAWRKDT